MDHSFIIEARRSGGFSAREGASCAVPVARGYRPDFAAAPADPPAPPSPENLSPAVDSLSTMLLIVDLSGRVVFASEEALGLLSHRDALLLDRGGVLHCQDREAERRLQHFLSKAVAAKSGCEQTVLAIPRRDGLPIAALLTRGTAPASVSTPHTAAKARITLLLRDPQRLGPDCSCWLVRLFGLSQGEATVAARLAQGACLEEIATQRGASVATVRNQLKSAYAKIGVSRQAELVSLVLRSTLF